MAHQILRVPRSSVRRQVGGRGHGDQTPVRPDADGDHVLFDAFAEADAGVVALLDDIAEGVVQQQLDADVGIGGQHRLQFGPDHRVQGVIGQGQPDGAGRLVAKRRQGGDLGLDLGHARGDGLQQPLARDGGGDVARRPGQKTDAHAGLQLLDGMAERRLRHAQTCRRLGEAALLGHSLEPGQLIEVGPFHGAFPSWSDRLFDPVD
ncbi:hypothetical protein D3C87_1479850 [compost metagenome]